MSSSEEAARRLLKANEVAEWLSVTPAVLANMRYMGTGPRFVKMGSSIRYAPQDVEDWIEANTHQQT